MNELKFLSRRRWLLLTASTLSGCGGGGNLLAQLPGTGGTGIFVSGSIAGFGSVIVNHIRFDDSAAAIQLDGVTRQSSELRLGMMAVVRGERGLDPTLGIASKIEVWSLAQGLVTSVNAQTGEFSLAGMVFQTDANTVFDGLASAAALASGLRLSVWGLQAGSLIAGAAGGRWQATRVALTQDATLVSTGVVAIHHQQPYLSGMLLSGAGASQLGDGQLVRVQGSLHPSGLSMVVERVSSRATAQAIADNHATGEIEMEAVVTALVSARRFSMAGVDVDASAAVVSPSGVAISVGQRLEVEGTWQAGLLLATKVGVKNEASAQVIEIKAKIEQFTSLANFVVRGQRCDASAITSMGHGTPADLQVGVLIGLKGTLVGNVLLVSELEIDD